MIRTKTLSGRAPFLSWSALALLGLSVSLNLVLAARLRAQTTAVTPHALRIGTRVEPIAVLDRRGQPSVIRFDRNVPTVLYFFSPTCAWCERNLDNINAIAANADGRYRVIGLAAEPSLADYERTHVLKFDAFGGVSAEAREALSLTGTPRTVIVSAQGLVTHEWTGAFTGPNARPVEQVFGIVLPGLVRPGAAPAR